MPRTRKKPQKVVESVPPPANGAVGDVLTLAEAAAYLRVPVSEMTAFHRRRAPGGGDAGAPPAPPQPQPVDQAIEYLTKAYPLQTAGWASWRSDWLQYTLTGLGSLALAVMLLRAAVTGWDPYVPRDGE